MSKQPYNPQLVTEYLLGSLPEDELERLDELSITDDAFVAALSAAEKDLVDAYFQGELTGQRLEKFKSHYLSSPLRRQRSRFAEAFKIITERSVIAAQPGRGSTRQKVLRWPSLLTTFAPQSFSRWAFAAAAVAFLVVGVWLGIQNVRLGQQVATTQSQLHELKQRQQELQKEVGDQRSTNSQDLNHKGEDQVRLDELQKQIRSDEQQRSSRQRPPIEPGQSTIASFMLTPQMRSVGAIPIVSLPTDTLYVRLNLKLEPNDYRSYRVALVDAETNQDLWRSGKLDKQKGNGDTIGVSLRAVLLKPKTYVIHLFGTSTDGVSEFITQYPFKVVQQ